MEVSLSTLRAGRPPFTPRKIPATHFCYWLSRPQGHIAAGGNRSVENSNDLGNRIRDLPACSTVPQPTTLLRALHSTETVVKHARGSETNAHNAH
jgi:hypothetical protein